MKVLVCGSRSYDDVDQMADVLSAAYSWSEEPVTLIHGGARGADQLAAACAVSFGWPAVEYKPDWDRQGRKAGYMRNEVMVREADEVWAFWDGESKGTKHSIDLALHHKKHLHVVFFSTSDPSEQQDMTYPST